jgi:hypothetical protein
VRIARPPLFWLIALSSLIFAGAAFAVLALNLVVHPSHTLPSHWWFLGPFMVLGGIMTAWYERLRDDLKQRARACSGRMCPVCHYPLNTLSHEVEHTSADQPGALPAAGKQCDECGVIWTDKMVRRWYWFWSGNVMR